MRIALVYDAVYPYVVGGGEHRNYALAERWNCEHDVAFYGLHYWVEDQSRCLPRCRYIAVGPPVPLYDDEGRRRVLEALSFAVRLFLPLLRSRDDIWDVASFPYFSVPVARLASLLRCRPLLVTWFEFWGEYWYEYLGWWGFLGRAVERLALVCSPTIVAISERTRQRIVAAGYPADRITVVPCGVDVGRIHSVAPAAQSFTLVYAGRLVAHKQIDLLLRAMVVLRQEMPGVTLGIIGDGPERTRLANLAEHLDVRDGVTFLGRLATESQVYAHLKAGKVLVLPSRREGFGMAVVQGWACGLPAVVCDEPTSALAELIDDPIKGRVVPSDPRAIARACQDLLTRDTAGHAARLREAADGFDWAPIAEQLLRTYRGMIAAAR